MRIKLKNWKVVDLNFSILDNKTRKENNFGLKVTQAFSETPSNLFTVVFDIDIKDKKFDVKLESVFNFETDDTITEDFKISDFPKINAPAIAFPYLRAYISNLTLQSGFKPVLLPSINFVELVKRDANNNNKATY